MVDNMSRWREMVFVMQQQLSKLVLHHQKVNLSFEIGSLTGASVDFMYVSFSVVYINVC